MKALGATIIIVGLTTFPAVGAIVQLGAALSAVDRMHASKHAAYETAREAIGTYEVDPATLAAGLHLREVEVRRARVSAAH